MISKRYHYVFHFFRPFFKFYNRLVYGMQPVPDPDLGPNQPALVLSNHVNNLDPFFLATGIPRPIFFIASDHIFRLGLISKIISWLVAPIPIVKSHIDLRTMRTIHKLIKDGAVIGLFPEGNRNFNGLTGSIPPATGKLIRQLKATVLIYKIHGYHASPRWARYSRRGPVKVSLSQRIEPAELQNMTSDEINQIISQNIKIDAYAEQYINPKIYRGRRLAEHLERALFLCPKCYGLATLVSKNDRFYCSCGLAVRITLTGFFVPDDEWTLARKADGTFFDTVSAWDQWQRSFLPNLLERPDIIDMTGKRPIFTDNKEKLLDCHRAKRNIVIDRGCFSLFVDRFEFSGYKNNKIIFPLTNIERVIVIGGQILQFTDSSGLVYEIRSKKARSAYKYVILYYVLKHKNRGDFDGFFGF